MSKEGIYIIKSKPAMGGGLNSRPLLDGRLFGLIENALIKEWSNCPSSPPGEC